MLTKHKLASVIDAAVLHANATDTDITKACAEARTYHYYGLDVNLSFAALAKKLLKKSTTKLVVTIGYPLGATSSETKMFEAIKAVKLGADELDMVMNISAFKSSHYDVVGKDIRAVVDAAQGLPVKVIIETGFLTHEEIMTAAHLAASNGAHFVKTCTGYGPRGVSITDVRIIRKAVGQNFGIKASGTITTAQHALALLEAGATRIGTSHAKHVLETL